MYKNKTGGFVTSNKNRIRILLVTWFMGVFILNAYYTSQLVGYLMINIPVPVVNSAEELADKPGVDLVVLSGWAAETTILVQVHLLLTYINFITLNTLKFIRKRIFL